MLLPSEYQLSVEAVVPLRGMSGTPHELPLGALRVVMPVEVLLRVVHRREVGGKVERKLVAAFGARFGLGDDIFALSEAFGRAWLADESRTASIVW